MTAAPTLGDYVRVEADPELTAHGFDRLGTCTIADLADRYVLAHADALDRAAHRIHPSARIHPTACIGDDVLIGPDVVVHEFSTVRDGSVLSRGVSVGFGCEVVRSLIAQDAVLGHRISLSRTFVGSRVHLGIGVLVASVSLWNDDMRHPDKEITVRLPSGETFGCRTPKFGAVLGDGSRCAAGAVVGPGALIGPGALVYSGVHLSGTTVPARAVVRPMHAPGDIAVAALEPRPAYTPVREPRRETPCATPTNANTP